MSDELAAAFADLKQRYKPGVLDRELSFYFSLGNRENQKWTARLGPQGMEYEQGKVEGCDVFLKTSEDLFLQLVRGQYKPSMVDFMSGKLSSNDPFKLTLLKDCFER